MSDFVKFAENGNLDEVKRLFQPKIINTRDKENDTALLKASQNCNATNVVSFLLKNGADIDDRDLIDQTPLIVASQHGCKDIVELLLKAGSNIKHKNQQGETALISATQEGHIDVVKFLLDAGADKNEPNAEGETPLMLAINLRHKKDLVKLLIHYSLKNM
jgi:ankyrin repeat protein